MDECLAQMWHDFRHTIDELVFPKTKKWAERDGIFKAIEADGKAVGFSTVDGVIVLDAAVSVTRGVVVK